MNNHILKYKKHPFSLTIVIFFNVLRVYRLKSTKSSLKYSHIFDVWILSIENYSTVVFMSYLSVYCKLLLTCSHQKWNKLNSVLYSLRKKHIYNGISLIAFIKSYPLFLLLSMCTQRTMAIMYFWVSIIQKKPNLQNNRYEYSLYTLWEMNSMQK